MSTIPETLAYQQKAALTAQQAIVQNTTRQAAALANSKAKGLRAIEVYPSHGRFLSLLCKMKGAKSVLEIGTLGGYSTMWFAESVPGIKVTSIEYQAKHGEVALENLKGLDNIKIHLGAALDVLPELDAAGEKFDFVFIDADWPNQDKYFDWAVRLSNPGGCIYVDNVIRQITYAQSVQDPTATALIDFVKKDDRVEATVIPTLGPVAMDIKTIADGFIVALVK